MRLIDADLLLATSSGVTMIIPVNIHPHEAIKIQGNAFREAVEKAPTVDAVEVVRWIPVSEPPTTFRDEYGELIPFLVCEKGTKYPFRAMYDGMIWGDGLFAIPVTHWMPLPQPPKGE